MVVRLNSGELFVDSKNKLVPLDCSATTELHVVSFQSAFLQTVDVQVNRTAPVVLFLNVGTPLRVLRVTGTTVTRVVVMSEFAQRDVTLLVGGVSVTFLDQFPYTALPFAFDVMSDATKRIMDGAEQFTGLSLTSFHGASTLSTLSIGRASTEKACATCGPLQRIDGRASVKCTCVHGFVRASDGAPCVAVARTVTAVTTRASNGAPVEVRLRSSEPVSFGPMRCLFGSKSVPAYWRNASDVACVIDPKDLIAPALYDAQLVVDQAPAVSATPQVDIVDGAALCASATSCGVCDKTACVYCGDGARQCVPGTARQGPVGQCDNWFSQSCPDFVLTLDGAPQRASITGGSRHTYSFAVAAGRVEDVRIDVLSFPRQVQMNSEVSLLLRKDAPALITSSSNGLPVGTWDLASLTDGVPRGDFSLRACNLTEGTYFFTLLSQRPYSYDVRVNAACDCSARTTTAPSITSLSPAFGALLTAGDVVRTVDIAGTGFSSGRSTCRFEVSGVALPLYSPAQQASGRVQCQVPSFDEATGASLASKVPNSARVSVSNDRCLWSNELPYRQFLSVLLGDQRTRAALPSSRLAVGQRDYFRIDTTGLGVTAVSFFVRQLEPGSVNLFVMPQEARDAPLACGGSVRCGERLSGSLANERRLADCALQPDIWYFVVENNGTAPVGYLAGSECGCGDATPIGAIKSVTPAAGNVVGYDVLTIRGSGFQNATSKRCVFDGEGESPAVFVSSTEVQCVSVAQLSAFRPRAVALTVEGDSFGTLANKPCAKSTPFAFPYYVQLNRGQAASVDLDATQPSFFLFDFTQSVQRRRDADATTESFKVTLTPSNVIRRFVFDVRGGGELPDMPDGAADAVKGEQSKLYCHVPISSRYFIGVWSTSDAFRIKVAISDPPECLNMTASPLPQTNADGPGTPTQATNDGLSMTVGVVAGLTLAVVLF